MVRIATLLPLLMLFFPLILAKPISWMDYEDALRQAPGAKKLVYVYFYSETCPSCQLMEKVFDEPSVSDAVNTDFLPVRVNVAQRPDIASAFMVPATPAHLFICPDGTSLGGALGYRDAESFLELLRAARSAAEQRCPDLTTSESGASRSQINVGLGGALLFSLLIGLATPLSPCILPLLPVVYLVAAKGGKRGIILFVLGLFSLSSLLGVAASGFLLALRYTAEPIAYAMLIFAGLTLLLDRLNRGLSQLTSRMASKVAGGVKKANPYMLGALSSLLWSPCAAPMAAAAFSLSVFAGSEIGAAAIGLTFAAGLSAAVYVLILIVRKVRLAAIRGRALRQFNRLLGTFMVVAALLRFLGFI